MSIESRIKALIKQNSLKQNTVAKRIGMSAHKLSQILNGHRKLLASDFILICTELKISPNAMIGDSNDTIVIGNRICKSITIVDKNNKPIFFITSSKLVNHDEYRVLIDFLS